MRSVADLLVSLLSFNVGIETGQAMLLVAVFPLVLLVRRSRFVGSGRSYGDRGRRRLRSLLVRRKVLPRMIRLASSPPVPDGILRHHNEYTGTRSCTASPPAWPRSSSAVPLTGALADAVDAPSATITGTVFEDRDNDGRIDDNETGLAGVSVSDGQQIVVTDLQGRYTFETDTERRDVDLVFITQPAGYSVGTDDNMTPKFYRNLGSLAAWRRPRGQLRPPQGQGLRRAAGSPSATSPTRT